MMGYKEREKKFTTHRIYQSSDLKQAKPQTENQRKKNHFIDNVFNVLEFH